MQKNHKIPPPGCCKNMKGPKISKGIRESLSKNPKAKKQTTISNYWLMMMIMISTMSPKPRYKNLHQYLLTVFQISNLSMALKL